MEITDVSSLRASATEFVNDADGEQFKVVMRRGTPS
jgi:hypothetical protein